MCQNPYNNYICILCCRYNGASQQCCYDSTGALLTKSAGRGTIHKTSVHANNYFEHFENDYFPYLVCCPKNCNEYYQRRASDDCSNYLS